MGKNNPCGEKYTCDGARGKRACAILEKLKEAVWLTRGGKGESWFADHWVVDQTKIEFRKSKLVTVNSYISKLIGKTLINEQKEYYIKEIETLKKE